MLHGVTVSRAGLHAGNPSQSATWIVSSELTACLHEGNIASYRLRLDEFSLWKAGWQ
jgi:hypothetical protein